jgi:putative iron-dependent peroxidase
VTAQPGIFALGTPEHCYLELALVPDADPVELVRGLATLVQELSTTGGVNVVVGVRPELWRALAPGDGPQDAAGFDQPLVGPDGFSMPATQHDAWLWLAGGDWTAVFDGARAALQALAAVAGLASEVHGWLYRSDRDLTGFIDGTENPSVLEAVQVATVPEDGSSVLLYQLWRHDSAAWEALGERRQELAMGRTKQDSIELDGDVMPASAHVARAKSLRDGEEQQIFRRNVAYGNASDHGTAFVGFSPDRWRLNEMLERMAGVPDGVRCELTRYLTPTTGGYYTVPAVESLARFAGTASDGSAPVRGGLPLGTPAPGGVQS